MKQSKSQSNKNGGTGQNSIKWNLLLVYPKFTSYRISGSFLHKGDFSIFSTILEDMPVYTKILLMLF
jgi:hypothetical protein